MTPRLLVRLSMACAAVAALSISGPGRAQDKSFTFDLVTSRTEVSADGTWTVDSDITIKGPKDNPSRIVRVPMIWAKSVETLEITDARVVKAARSPGRLPDGSIRDDPFTGDRYFHEYVDQGRKVITFNDVEEGDVLHIQTLRTVKHPRVPGGFMTAPVLDPSVRWEEISDTIMVPDAMSLIVETRGFDHQAEKIAGRTAHYFHSSKAVTVERGTAVVGDFDRLPRYAASTFPDWDAFGQAYASVLLPYAKATIAIRALAEKLTAEKQDERAIAQALYDWVRDHVRHVPISLQESRPAPNDAETVLTNLFGDDKDHVVLLRALLAAKGIPAEIALLNAGDTSTIAGPPNIRPMNHLIIYLPSLDLYTDSTLGVAPFGVLPFRELGKPVIHLGGAGPARRVTPIPTATESRSEMTTDATLGANGEIEGRTETTGYGPFAVWLRGAAQAFGETGTQRGAAAVTLLREHGTPGTGTFSFDAPASASPSYSIGGTFKLHSQPAFLNGGYFALWTGLRILPRPGDFLAGPILIGQGVKTEQTFCYPGQQREELRLTLPKGREPGTLPKDEVIDTGTVHFASHWGWDGQRVSVVRTFRTDLPGPVCEGAVREQLAKTLARIRSGLTSQIGIKSDIVVSTPAEVAGPR